MATSATAAATGLTRRLAVLVRTSSSSSSRQRYGRTAVRSLATRAAAKSTTARTVTSRSMSSSAAAGNPPPLDAAAADAIPDGGVIPGSAVRVFRTVAALRAWRRALAPPVQASVGLVPTMGALHAGHAALVRRALDECAAVVVSVYVNPTQFGVHEDLGSYPRTWAADCGVLRGLAAGDSASPLKEMAVFAPTTPEMYPSGPPSQAVDGPGSYVTITPAGSVLEGASRPTFFRGVATVCMKLFHIAQPARAYFGQKDVQQAVVLRRLVRDFHVPLVLVVAETVRDAAGDGLAQSSRNVYLGARRRRVAGVLRRALVAGQTVFARGERDAEAIRQAARQVLEDELAAQRRLPASERVLFEPDYVSVADPDSMAEMTGAVEDGGAILSGAMRMLPVEAPQPGEDLGHSGGPAVRLIDNVLLGREEL